MELAHMRKIRLHSLLTILLLATSQSTSFCMFMEDPLFTQKLEIQTGISLYIHNNNTLDIIDEESNTIINQKPIHTQKKDLLAAALLEDQMLYVRDKYRNIDLFDMYSGTKLNKKPIKIRKNQQISYIEPLDSTTLCITYEEPQPASPHPSSKPSVYPYSTSCAAFEKNEIPHEYDKLKNLYIMRKTLKFIDLFDIESSQKIHLIRPNQYLCGNKIHSVEMNRYVITWYNNNQIKILDIHSWQKLNYKSIQLPPDKRIYMDYDFAIICNILFVRYEDRTIDLFDIKTDHKINKNPIQAPKDMLITDIEFLDHKKIFYLEYKILPPSKNKTTRSKKGCSDRGKIILFNTKTGNKINQVPIEVQNVKDIRRIKLLDKNNTFCIGYKNKKFELFDTKTGNKLKK